jgi:hypothetical protein
MEGDKQLHVPTRPHESSERGGVGDFGWAFNFRPPRFLSANYTAAARRSQEAVRGLVKMQRSEGTRSLLRFAIDAIVAGVLVSLCVADCCHSAEPIISPERLGLPKGNLRSSEPFVTRVYVKSKSGETLVPQPANYPKTVSSPYRPKSDEKIIIHYGVDLTSRELGTPAPLKFRAGVYGKVMKAGDGPWGTITVQVEDGSLLQYLHTSKSFVKVGDLVEPSAFLGKTGATGAGVIHLHIQAHDDRSNFVSPDLVFATGAKQGMPKATFTKDELEFHPEESCGVEPRIINGIVQPVYLPPSKWIVEVIGSGGRVDEVLGEFYDWQSASYCARQWSDSRPEDLRLTREREVNVHSPLP